MKILYLGPFREKLISYLKSHGDQVVHLEDRLEKNPEILEDIDYIISYGYRYIIKKDIVDKFRKRAINLHISYLPWNKGSDPNLWSFLEDSPKGVTIHYIDYGIDTGDILVQKKVEFSNDHTLKTSYETLSCEIEKLLMQNWPKIKMGNIKATPQREEGTTHRKKDKEPYLHLLISGWDTPITHLIGKAKIRSLKDESL